MILFHAILNDSFNKNNYIGYIYFVNRKAIVYESFVSKNINDLNVQLWPTKDDYAKSSREIISNLSKFYHIKKYDFRPLLEKWCYWGTEIQRAGFKYQIIKPVGQLDPLNTRRSYNG